jgi:globin
MTLATCPPLSVPAEAETINLYEAIGGHAAVVAAVDVFYRRVLADPELAPFFPGGVGARHRRYLATFLGQALGVPGAIGDPISLRPTGAWASPAPTLPSSPPTWTPSWPSWGWLAT